MALVAAVVTWAVIASSGCGSSSAEPGAGPKEGTGPVALSASGLAEIVRATGQPIAWVGPRPNTMYELQQTVDGKTYIRYLPKGIEAGDGGAYLTVGTYPMVDAYATTQAAATAEGSVPIPMEGATAFYSESGPKSAYVAYSGSGYQTEVWDPVPGAARALVSEGAVEAVQPSAGTRARAVTAQQLAALAASLGRPVYWAGPDDGMTYELAQTAEGLLYVRYLPAGVTAGDDDLLRTVATYPVTDAFEKTKAVALESDMKLVELGAGGVAAVPRESARKSVYVAYPDIDIQVEVFDPKPGEARKLVESGRVVPLG